MSRDMEDILYYMSTDVGLHGHRVMPIARRTAVDGEHSHVWLVPEAMETPMGDFRKDQLIWASYDGPHEHPLMADLNGTEVGGEHEHAVMLNGLPSPSERGGSHGHAIALTRTARDGIHGHMLNLNGTMLHSLMPADFFAMLDAAVAGEAAEGLASQEEMSIVPEDSSGTWLVQHKGVSLSRHSSLEGAKVMAASHDLFMRCGLQVRSEDLVGVEWLVRAVALETLEIGKANLVDRMAGTFGRLLEE